MPFLRSITWRFTTRVADESFCLAILLGFTEDQIRTLIQLPPDPVKLLKYFLLQQRYLPKDIIFWPSKSHLRRSKGFHWATDTFLGRQIPIGSWLLRTPFRKPEEDRMDLPQASSYAESYFDEQGFHVQHAGIAVQVGPSDQLSGESILFYIENVSLRYTAIFIHDGQEHEDPEAPWKCLGEMQNPALILPRFEIHVSSEPQIAVLVDRIGVEEENGSEIYCTYKAQLLAYCYGPGELQDSTHETYNDILCAQNLGEVKWCIR